MTRRRRGAVYELSVCGRLGPVLRTVLRPWGRSSTTSLTTLVVDVPDDADLVDIVARLESHGLEIEHVGSRVQE